MHNKNVGLTTRPIVWMMFLLALSVIVPPAWAQTGGDYDLHWSTVDGGGGVSTGAAYILSGTIGQPDAGDMSGGDYVLTGGFWGVKWSALCMVDLPDLAGFASEWLLTELDAGYAVPADLDGSGEVDLIDYSIFAGQWLQQCPEDWPW